MIGAHPNSGLHASHSSAEEFDPHSTLRKSPCLMTSIGPEYQPSSGRKRKRGPIEDEQWTTAKFSPQPPWKRAKKPFSSRQQATTVYWDSLSKLSLTRRALRESDRRNRRAARPAEPAFSGRPEWSRDLTAPTDSAKHIRRLARQGGPDLGDLRGYPEPGTANSIARAMPSDQSTSRTKSKSVNTLAESTAKTSHRKSSAYHRDFEQHLIDHGVYPSHYDFLDDRESQRPKNEEEILDRLALPRPSLSPSRFSNNAFDNFVRTNSRALTEPMVMRNLIPTISGDANIPSAGELPFGNLEPLTDGTLVDAKPDFYDGARPAQIHGRIREELSSHITPSTQQHAPALPNFFIEGKGPDGSTAVAKRQACYDGALGARGIHRLRSFGVEASETLYDSNAYTITSTYHDGTLKMYTSHPTQGTDPECSPEYHMTQLRSLAMTDTAERFREGASAFRNARDWAKEQRDSLIAAANGRVRDAPFERSSFESSRYSALSPSTNEPLPESETSADEFTLELSKGTHHSNKRPKRRPEIGHTKPGSKKRSRKASSRADGRSERGTTNPQTG
ncbi:MAG: hypothetical protein M1837_000629 [Sclerophora amabilis]|nr:MAG: hypothetical protein M1837_000629 [Sclerophora amabilis]